MSATDTPTKMILCQECGEHEHHDFNDRCHHCHNRAVEEYRAERKRQLDAEPRCECCKRRGSWTLSGDVLLCGVHKNRVEKARQRETASWGIIGLLGAAPLTREQILELAA